MLIGQGAQNRSIWRDGPRLAVDARPPCPTIWRERAGPSLPPSCVVATCCSCSAGGSSIGRRSLPRDCRPFGGMTKRSLRCYAPERGKTRIRAKLGGAGAYGLGSFNTARQTQVPSQRKPGSSPEGMRIQIIAYASGNSVVPVRERVAMSLSSRRGASAAAGTRSPVRTWRRLISVLPILAALVLAACSGGAGGPVPARQVSGQPPPCSANPPPEAPPLQADHGHHDRAGLLLRVRPLLRRAGAG